MVSRRLFISYRRSDTAQVDALVTALEAEGVEVWIDRREIDDAASIQASIDEGLARSHALLAWYSADYPKSRACQWELTAAMISARAETAPVRRILVVNPESTDAHIGPLGVRDLQYHIVADDLLRLARAVAADLAPIQGELGALRRLAKPPAYGFAPLGSNRFVGRLDKLWEIHSTLSAGRFAIVSGRPSPAAAGDTVQVRGSGGIGKSLLAEEYALRFGAFWPGGVFWLRAYGNSDNPEETEEQLTERRRLAYDSQWLDFATRLGLETHEKTTDELRAAVARKMTEPYLWIVDDLHACGREEFERWLAPSGAGQNLVTTRSRRLDSVGEAIDLGVLSQEDAHALLTRDSVPNPDEDDAIARILTLLDGHALALDIARAACRRIGYTDFLRSLESPEQDVLTLAARLAPELPNGHNPHIAATFMGGVKQLDEHGRDCLVLATHLANAPIPFDLVADALAQAGEVDQATAKEHAALGVQQLLDHSLADEGQGPNAFSIHNLLRLTAHQLELVTRQQSGQLRQAAIAVLKEKMHSAHEISKHNSISAILPHSILLAQPLNAESCGLAHILAVYEFAAGHYSAAEKRWRKLYEWFKDSMGSENSDTLNIVNNLALSLGKLGNYSEAHKLQRMIETARQRGLRNGPISDYSDVEIRLQNAYSLMVNKINQASIYRAKGDYPKARRMYEEVLPTLIKYFGEAGEETIKTTINYVTVLLKLEKANTAKTILHQALERCKLKRGEEHPLTLSIMHSLEAVLFYQSEYAASYAIGKEVVTIRQRVLEENHPDTLTSMNSLAQTLWALEDHANARALQVQVLELRKRKLGSRNPSTTISAWNLLDMLNTLSGRESAQSLADEYLRWLIDEDPISLGADQRKVRELVIEWQQRGCR